MYKFFHIRKKVLNKSIINVSPYKRKAFRNNTISFKVHHDVKRGLLSHIREIITFKILDKIIRYEYKYEHSHFEQTEAFKTPEGFIKLIYKTVDNRFDIVANDLVAKHFNGLKTFFTLNTGVLKFSTSFQKAKPLRKLSLFTKRLEGLYPKQKEFYDMSGGNKNFHTMQIMKDPTTKSSILSNIFNSFSAIRRYVINMLSQISALKFKKLINTVFIKAYIYKHKFKVFLTGFKGIIKKRKTVVRHIPRRKLITMHKKDIPEKTKKIRKLFNYIHYCYMKYFCKTFKKDTFSKRYKRRRFFKIKLRTRGDHFSKGFKTNKILKPFKFSKMVKSFKITRNLKVLKAKRKLKLFKITKKLAGINFKKTLRFLKKN